MNKEDEVHVYMYIAVLFSHNKEGNSAICYSMDKTARHYGK